MNHWKYDPSDWVFSNTDDLAALDVTERINFSEEFGLAQSHMRSIDFIMERFFVSDWFERSYNIGVGDDTIMLGLLAQHDGGKLNLPVARFGNIAAAPSSLAPVQLSPRDRFVRPAWLNDCRSRGGFSGSPVWVWRNQYDDMNLYNGPGLPDSLFAKNQPARHSFLALLGCHRGQFREDTTVYAKGESSLSARPLKSGDDIEIASAMTVIVPAWEISKLMHYPELEAQRNERDLRPERQKYSNEVQKVFRAQEQAGIFANRTGFAQ